MHLDVVDLRNFYYRTRLGRAAQKVICERVRELWPDTRGQTVLGFGFAVPLLRSYLEESRRVIALMPGQQGVMHWPPSGPNISVLCEEGRWPIETGHADRLILMHALETSENPAGLLDECRRVLGPGGRALLVVPNRAGLWSRSDATPFGVGRPYSLSQLETLLKRQSFIPERHRSALYQPPSQKRFWLQTGQFLESTGRRIPRIYAGGVLIVEVSRRVSAPTRPGLTEAVRRPLEVLDGIARPGARPVSRIP
jgi:SAM-dependent methyltransferase